MSHLTFKKESNIAHCGCDVSVDEGRQGHHVLFGLLRFAGLEQRLELRVGHGRDLIHRRHVSAAI